MTLLPLVTILAILCISLLGFCLFQGYRQLKKYKSLVAVTQYQLLKQVESQQLLGVELSNLKEKFTREVLLDSLTELPGRQVFEDRLLQTLNQSKRYQLAFGIMFLDLDGFKIINEALGHDIGDLLLKEVGERVLSSIRRVDSASRFSGDKFVVLLEQLSKPESAVYAAQRVLDAISQPFNIQGNELFITASIGIATYPNDGDDQRVLLKNADNALHRAKARGRNGYQFYHEDMYVLSQRELTLNSSLQQSNIFKDFIIFYQPIINVKTEKVVSIQALLQWQHPDFGLMPLTDFLQVAENNGVIVSIGKWLFENAFAQFKQWQKYDFCPNTIAVDVSLRQLENPHFTYRLSQILQECKLDPSCLILEISEVTLLTKLDTIEKTFHMLKHLGIQIGIKDFGAGQLSLQHLKRFSIDYLKIANALIQDVTINKNSEAIIKMVMALSKSLQIEVVAADVESQKQKNLLADLGCYNMQGNLFSAPFTAEEFTQDKVLSCTTH